MLVPIFANLKSLGSEMESEFFEIEYSTDAK